MTDLGVYQAGDFVPVPFQTATAAGVPDWPDAAPVLRLFGPAGTVVLATYPPACVPATQEGLFLKPLRLGSTADDAGLYTAVVTWKVSGAFRCAGFFFRVVAGGDTDGAVVALRHVRRPEADYLVRVTESGLVARGRNPR